jgi:hypothetical protein
VKSILHDTELRRLQFELRAIHDALRANRAEIDRLRGESAALRQRREHVRRDIAATQVGLSAGCGGELTLDATSLN